VNSFFIKNIIFSLAILFTQIMVLNQLNISQSILPLIYPILIFSLNRSLNKSLLLVLSFGLGLVMDVFSNTGGAHAIACTLLAFVRPFFLSSIGPMDMGSDQIKPSIISLGLKNYLAYSFLLLAIHHIAFFMLEVFSFSNFLDTALRIIGSLIVSWLLVISFQFLCNGKQR
jgi:rod shape-determining protein MreD